MADWLFLTKLFTLNVSCECDQNESHLSASCVAREEPWKLCTIIMLVIMSLFRIIIISDQIMEVEAMNLTAWYLAKKLVCLEDIEGGKFDVICASAESATDKPFYNHWRRTLLSSSLVACVVEESHTVQTWTGNAGQLRIDVRSNHCYPKALQRLVN